MFEKAKIATLETIEDTKNGSVDVTGNSIPATILVWIYYFIRLLFPKFKPEKQIKVPKWVSPSGQMPQWLLPTLILVVIVIILFAMSFI